MFRKKEPIPPAHTAMKTSDDYPEFRRGVPVKIEDVESVSTPDAPYGCATSTITNDEIRRMQNMTTTRAYPSGGYGGLSTSNSNPFNVDPYTLNPGTLTGRTFTPDTSTAIMPVPLAVVLDSEAGREAMICSRMRCDRPHMGIDHMKTVKQGETVYVFIVQAGEYVVVQDDTNLFPSDTLITQLRLLQK
jgi:hypothetical protein